MTLKDIITEWAETLPNAAITEQDGTLYVSPDWAVVEDCADKEGIA